MKCYLLFTLSLIILTDVASGQCTNTKIVNPAVAKPTAATIVSSTCSTLVVKWTGNAGESYVVSAIRYNPSTNTRDTVAGSSPVLISGLDYTSTIPVTAGKRVTWSVQASNIIAGSLNYSYPLEGTPVNYVILACGATPNTVAFSGKVFLQGPFNSGTMSNALNAQGILQANAASQPYNTPEFNYTGAESVGAGFFAAHPAITDWVLIELRDSIVSPSIISMRAAFVRQDGSLVDVDGTNTSITFPNMEPLRYYVSIRHRNHLGIRTTLPVNFETAIATYDFTTSLSAAYDGAGTILNAPMATLATAPNIYGMYGGNANADLITRKTGSATINDYSLLLSGIPSLPGPTNVYRKEDFNMDGNIRKTGSALTNDYSKLLNLLGTMNMISQPVF